MLEVIFISEEKKQQPRATNDFALCFALKFYDTHLEICVDTVKSIGVLRQLVSDVF